MKKRPDISRIIEFHNLLTAFAEIERVVHLKRRGDIVFESDTEHSYNLAMTTWFIAEYFPELDQGKVLKLALVHDLVEIHAGDTFIFADQAMLDSKKAREASAQRKLAKDWPDFPGLHASIKEYESLATPEACFVYAFDKLMPMIAVYLNEGITWHEKRMELSRLADEKTQKMAVAPEVLAYWHALHEILLAHPELFPA